MKYGRDKVEIPAAAGSLREIIKGKYDCNRVEIPASAYLPAAAGEQAP
jgi:hypothetical protein